MNQDIAVVLSWILAPALLVAVGVALYTAHYARQQRIRADALIQENRAFEEALEQLVVGTLPSIAESIRHDMPVPAVDVPAGVTHSRFAQGLRWVTERYADDLRLMQAETRELTTREIEERAQHTMEAAEQTVRTEVAAASRDATRGAVRSFGTSVVSAALREHRSDEVYGTLTRIDHTVQQMIRQAQSYVIVCGGLPGRRWPAQALTDVVGGATGRVRDYLRVRPNQLDRMVLSRAVEPLVHTLATLLDNALRYSPPTSFVDITFQEGHHGVTVIIDDAGVRMNAEQMEEARAVLAGERTIDIHQLGPSPRVGFPGVAALARRYGFAVYIDGPNMYGGMRAMVYIPEALLVGVDDPGMPQNAEVSPGGAPAVPGGGSAGTAAEVAAGAGALTAVGGAATGAAGVGVPAGEVSAGAAGAGASTAIGDGSAGLAGASNPRAGDPVASSGAATGGTGSAEYDTHIGVVPEVSTGGGLYGISGGDDATASAAPGMPVSDTGVIGGAHVVDAGTRGSDATAEIFGILDGSGGGAESSETSDGVHELTPGGLPKRRRRTAMTQASEPRPEGPRTEPGLARPGIVAAWHSGSQSGRAAGSEPNPSEHTEGTTS